ncbi:tautomerase family protein [Streptomyces xylophagus]|uniref:tautomerase family protein n=1 Tax=Streptomyces xylophagus TaxID=285514 RepID=UPI0005BB1FF2|nr:tautomerase family protein [Streptomyces xylophagus]
MPIYQCSAPVGILTDSMKSEIAAAITDAHVEATGAPRVFVHVFFQELPPGVAYSAGEIDTKISGIQGAIRAGRPLEVKQKLLKNIVASWSAITGQPEKQVLAGISEIDSDTSMEYGLILPHPGGETAWFATNAEALDGIQGTGL